MSPSEQLQICVVMLNWNGSDETLRSIASFRRSTRSDFHIVLLDNGSTDGSLNTLVTKLGDRTPRDEAATWHEVGDTKVNVVLQTKDVTLLHSPENLGFTGGMNSAIRYALDNLNPRYIFLANNDIVIDPGCLAASVEAAIEESAVVVGSLVLNADGSSVLFSGANPIRELFLSVHPVQLEELPERWETGRVEGSGALIDSFMIANEFRHRGYLFDPQLFLYGDDIDFALRARQAGGKIVMSKKAVVHHGLATSMGGPGNPMHYYYITRNRIYLARRWLSVVQRILFHGYFPLTRIMRAAQRLMEGKASIAQAILEGLIDGYRYRMGKWRRHAP